MPTSCAPNRFELLNEGVGAVRRGEYKDAIELLQQVASTALNSFRGHYYLGLALIGDRRHVEAVEALLYAIDLDPTHLQARVELGNAFLHQGDTDEAVAQYYQSLKLRAEYPPALDGIARVHAARGENEPAIKFFRPRHRQQPRLRRRLHPPRRPLPQPGAARRGDPAAPRRPWRSVRISPGG